ncbi:MAG: PTS-dependent dihydroxyacetone kinase phosphotransferase subunit DhaM [Oscillospiraceae bacterium]|nr:PTS-dependent dihydroxyacetone kinase phosphotransferase subunit DhaM [Oscillospiraceae bacterium]
MVGIVIVSHSKMIADGTAELALQMAPSAPIRAAGGLPDGGIGTDFQRIYDAIEAVNGPDGVVVLFDMGSSMMTAEMAIETLADPNVRLGDGPLVEGAIVAAVSSIMDHSLEEILAVVRQAGEGHKF